MNHSDGRAGGHGWLLPVVVCGLMLAGVVALGRFGIGWGGAIVAAALIACAAAMLFAMRASGNDR